MSVYKIFISNDLILFNIYIINIVFASKRLYTSLKQNIVTFPMALPSGYPMSPLMGLQHPTDPQLCFISPILAKRRIFFLLGLPWLIVQVVNTRYEIDKTNSVKV